MVNFGQTPGNTEGRSFQSQITPHPAVTQKVEVCIFYGKESEFQTIHYYSNKRNVFKCKMRKDAAKKKADAANSGSKNNTRT